MMGPAEVLIAFIIVGLPTLVIYHGFKRFFSFREKKLEVEAAGATEDEREQKDGHHGGEQRQRQARARRRGDGGSGRRGHRLTIPASAVGVRPVEDRAGGGRGISAGARLVRAALR